MSWFSSKEQNIPYTSSDAYHNHRVVVDMERIRIMGAALVRLSDMERKLDDILTRGGANKKEGREDFAAASIIQAEIDSLRRYVVGISSAEDAAAVSSAEEAAESEH